MILILVQAMKVVQKASPAMTYVEMENHFRANEFGFYLIALEKELPKTITIVNLQGKLDCKYQVAIHRRAKPKRAAWAEGWPASPEENLERLADAGAPMDRGVAKCDNCGGRLSNFPANSWYSGR